MSYSLLGQDLHEVADRAKKYFANNYGATRFRCEEPFEKDLPLRPTWQAKLKTGYALCVNVQPAPISPTLYEFVNKCAQRGIAVKLWVATSQSLAKENYSAELRQAHEAGIGVIQFSDDGSEHECHRAVPLSLFALKKTDLKKVIKVRREYVKNAESTFLDGTPDSGCNAICQELEDVTRSFAEYTYNAGYWTMPAKGGVLDAKFFGKSPWASVLKSMEERLEVARISPKCLDFSKQTIVRARGLTDWRNSVSHKPRTMRELQLRDAKLRTMYETSRDLLIDWYDASKPFKLLK